MKIGIIARAESRGLGHLTREVYRHIHPDRVLAVDMGEWARGFEPHRDWYPDATWVPFDGHAPHPFSLDMITEFVTGLDVVWSAETFYDWRIPAVARAAGCRTVLHTMPEFHRRPECDTVDAVWLPTPWRADHHPGAPLVPIPVAFDRFPESVAAADGPGPLRVLHTAGHRATMDRNGTLIVAEALRHVRRAMHVTITTQDPDVIRPVVPSNVTVDIVTGQGGDYWEQYTGHHLLALPRRYGGLCLPAQEALASGLAVIMPDVSPNEWWPTSRISGGRGSQFQAPAGGINTVSIDPRDLARMLDAFADDRGSLAVAQSQARAWAVGMSWDRQLPVWMEQFDHVMTGVTHG